MDALYGISMGGASVIRFLATEDISADKAIIDAGITPYPYPRWICRLISVKDWITMMLGTKSMTFMKLAAPPERWTPKGEDPEEHYRRIFEFEKHHFSPRTIYNVFWSTNNYSMPALVLSMLIGNSNPWGSAIGTMFLSFGNAFTKTVKAEYKKTAFLDYLH